MPTRVSSFRLLNLASRYELLVGSDCNNNRLCDAKGVKSGAYSRYKELCILQEMAQKKFGNVSMRILSKKEVIAAKLGVHPSEFERRQPSRLRLMKNKNRHVVN